MADDTIATTHPSVEKQSNYSTQRHEPGSVFPLLIHERMNERQEHKSSSSCGDSRDLHYVGAAG